MTSFHNRPLSELASGANRIRNETVAGFGNLTAQQLNWKPGADQWSVAQCYNHLVTANAAYLPIFERIFTEKKKNTFWESLPFLPTVWGKLVITAVSPETARKRKNPQIFDPSSSIVADGIIRRFVDQQNDILRHMKASESIAVEKIIISSPVSNLITYSLLDAYRIIVAHERRHLLQALRLLDMDGFPKDVR